MRWAIWFGFLALAWLGAFGIAFGVVEWRDTETADMTQLQPLPTASADPAQCVAAVAAFEALDTVLERGGNPQSGRLHDAHERALENMSERCFMPALSR